LGGDQTGMVFQNPQGIATFNGPMLRGVARENDPAVFSFR
jgi:hypothetical protein